MISTIDTVLLRIADNELQVLLWQRPQDSRAFAGEWALPGGWVFEEHDQTLQQNLSYSGTEGRFKALTISSKSQLSAITTVIRRVGQ